MLGKKLHFFWRRGRPESFPKEFVKLPETRIPPFFRTADGSAPVFSFFRPNPVIRAEIRRRWNLGNGRKRQYRLKGAVLFVTTRLLDLHRHENFVRNALRAERAAACQEPDDHAWESRLARTVKPVNQSDIPVDLDDEVRRILIVQAALLVQTAKTECLDAT